MTDDDFREKMSSNEKFPCIWCTHKVVRGDMPRVGVCKVCFVRERKKNTDTFKNYDTWREFFEKNETN